MTLGLALALALLAAAAAATTTTTAAAAVDVALVVSQRFVGSAQGSVDEQNRLTLTAMEEYILQGIKDYRRKEEGEESAPLFVFPEAVLWWYLPTKPQALAAASEHVTVSDGVPKLFPCEQQQQPNATTTDDVLSRLACLARAHGVFLVANLPTKNDQLLYNTAAAFAPSGQLLATYRKTHHWGANPPFDAPVQPDVSVFVGPAKRRFGLLVCFDLEFREPAASLLALAQEMVIAAPMSWQNTYPLSWATMYQQAFSVAHNATIVAANDGNSAYSWGAGGYGAGGHVLAQAFSAANSSLQPVVLPIPSAALQPGGSRAGAGAGWVELGKQLQETETDGAFPCSFPVYGSGRCVAIDSRAPSVSVLVSAGAASCSFAYQGLSLGGDDGSDGKKKQLVAVALDATLPTGSATPAELHVLLCGVVVCVPSEGKDKASGTASGTTVCGPSFEPFSLTRSPADAAPHLSVTLRSPRLAEDYLLLPMLAGSDGLGLGPDQWSAAAAGPDAYQLGVVGKAEGEGEAVLGLSSLVLKAVDQTTK